MLDQVTWVLQTHPVSIAMQMAKQFGGDWASWDSDTLLLTLPGLVEDYAQDKVLAVHAVIANSNLPCTHSQAFENVTNAFCHNPVIVDAAQPPDLPEMYYTVGQLEKIIRLVHDVDPQFGGEIPGYIAAVARYRRILVLPKRLAFAQDLLDSLNGITPDSRKRQEFSALYDDSIKLVNQLEEVDFTEDNTKLLDDLQKLVPPEHLFTAQQLIGCYLYDPTTW